MARVEDASSEEDDEPEVIIEDDATEQEEVDNESEASEDMSEGEEAEQALERRVQELEEQIQKDPYVYDEHIQLIETLEKLSELDRMRAAFERLHGVSPLAAEHWLQRLQMEATLAHTPSERQAVQQMYDRATTETYSIPLYMEWCGFALGGGEVEARDTFRRVLRLAGADPLGGRLLWEALKEHEREQLKSMSPESEEYGEQVARVARCLASQLTRPLLHTAASVADELREVARAHAAHLRDGYLEEVMQKHEQIKGIRDLISDFEDRLLTAKDVDEKCEIFTEYIERVRQMQEEDRDDECPFSFDELRMVLYDRATCECASCPLAGADALCEAWCAAARALGDGEYARALDASVSRRPRRAELWALAMQRLERDDKPTGEIRAVLEKALSFSLSQEGYLSVWMSYLECLRRRTDFADAEQCEILRKNMRRACTALQDLWGEEGDPDCSVLLFWARLEYVRMNDPARGKELFEEIFQSPYHKSLSRFWLKLIELESARSPRPPNKKLHELHRRALKFVADYPPAVAERWEEFEREHGTLHTLLQCRTVCREKLKEWQASYDAQKSKKNNQKGQKNNQKGQKNNQKGQKNKSKALGTKKSGESVGEGAEGASPGAGGKGKKRAAAEGSPEGAKRKREGGEQGTDADKGADADEGTATYKEAVTAQNGGLKRKRDEAETTAESKRPRAPDAAEPGAHNGSAPPPDAEKEACTLFVSNLDFKFDEAALRSALGAWGDLRSLRVVRGVKAFGGSICYCQYATPESVEEAVKHDRTPLDGRPMFLSRYRAEREKPRFRYATAPERNKLFVRNLPFAHCTQAALRDVFAQHGALVDVRIVTYKDGRPKGLAYVEYADERSAAAALQATDDLLLGERRLQVALSAPPPRAAPSPAASSAAALGQGRRDTAGPRRTQLSSFVPRALQKPIPATASSTPAAPTAGPSETSASASKPMSNSDFRSMLLNK